MSRLLESYDPENRSERAGEGGCDWIHDGSPAQRSTMKATCTCQKTRPAICSTTPFTGKVLRLKENGDVEEIASGLFLPTAMTFGPDGDLYVSNVIFGPPSIGLGEVVRITVPPVE
jgi:hypothetical protein